METLTFVSVIIGSFSAICAIIFGYAAFKRTEKNEDTSDGVQTGTIMSDIGYIKSGIDDIKRKQEGQENFNLKIMAEITSAKNSASSAHKRIDSIEERLNH